MMTVPLRKPIGNTTFVCHANDQIDTLRSVAQAFDLPLLTIAKHHHPPGRVSVDQGQELGDSPILTLAVDVERLNHLVTAVGLKTADFQFRVLVDHLLLARREVVASISLDGLNGFNSWTLSTDLDALGSARGYDIRLIAYLEKDRKTKAGLRAAPGMWILTHKFEIRPTAAQFRFAPHPLTKDVRSSLGIPRDTLSHTQLSGNVLDCDSLADITDVFIDEEVLELLAESPNSAASISFQVMFATQVLTAIVNEVVVQLHDSGESHLIDVEQTSAGRLIRDVARANGIDVPTLVQALLKNSSLSSTYVQALLQARKRVALAVREMV